MKHFRKLLCSLFGHRSIVIFHSCYERDYPAYTSDTRIYKCERCGREEQYDYQKDC